jgi:hypothetical protein
LLPRSLLRFSAEWCLVRLTLPNASALKVCSFSKLPNHRVLRVSSATVASWRFHHLKHPVAGIPYPPLSWGLFPYSVSNLERPFRECRNTRQRSSSCPAFPPSRFLTSLTIFSAPCLPGIFHPVTLMGFALQRFSPPASLNASRHPYLPSVSSLAGFASEVLLQPVNRLGGSCFQLLTRSILS